MIFSSRNYAIGMAHYQIAGGLKVLLALMGAYVVVVGSIIGLIIYNTPPSGLRSAMEAFATFLLVMEGIGIVVMGGVRIAGCIRMDLLTNMIESHRQMPISAARAMLGYLFGSTVHVIAVLALNMIVLAIVEGMAGVSFETFVLAQIVLCGFALFVWAFSAMTSLMFRQAMPMIVLFFVFGSCGGMFLRAWGLLPGLSLLAAPFLGETIFNLARGRITMHAAYPVALTAQAAFAILCFIGACRRYRGSYRTTFNVLMGILLVAVWGVLSVVAIAVWPSVATPFGREFGTLALNAQLVASLCVAALLVFVPIYALAQWEAHQSLPAIRRWIAILAILLVGVISLLAVPFTGGLWFICCVVMAAHTITIYAVLRAFARSTPTIIFFAILVLMFLVWAAPMILEAIRWYFEPWDARGNIVADYSIISTFSPLGLLLAATSDADHMPTLWVGMLFQMSLAVILLYLAQLRGSKIPGVTPETPLQSAPS